MKGIVVILLIIAVIAIGVIIDATYQLLQLNKPQKTYKQENKEINKPDRAHLKGKYGEEYIINLLGKTIPWQRYLVNNVIITDKNGNSNQIDHVFINSNGIFVIETKNYSGTIYGNDYQKEWTQVFNYGKQKFKFYNPILQNKKHTSKLIEATKTKLPIKSIVVFTNNKIDKIESKSVYTPKDMIYEINARFDEKITPKEMDDFYNLLMQIKNNQISDDEHIENVKRVKKTI